MAGLAAIFRGTIFWSSVTKETFYTLFTLTSSCIVLTMLNGNWKWSNLQISAWNNNLKGLMINMWCKSLPQFPRLVLLRKFLVWNGIAALDLNQAHNYLLCILRILPLLDNTRGTLLQCIVGQHTPQWWDDMCQRGHDIGIFHKLDQMDPRNWKKKPSYLESKPLFDFIWIYRDNL